MLTATKNSLIRYKTLPVWTETTLPQKFQTKHNTQVGTWGKIIVESGQLQYEALSETGEVQFTQIISPEHTDFFVSPGAWHCVRPLGPLRCFIEFYCKYEDYFQKKYKIAAPHRDVKTLILGPLRNHQDLNILDLGSGLGRNATYLYTLGHRVTALDKNADAIHRLQEIIRTENMGERFQAQVYDIESAALCDCYDLIVSTVVFQFLNHNAISKVIENMQTQTNRQGYHFIIAPLSLSTFPCPIDFPSTFNSQELRNYYSHWRVCDYREEQGTFHRKDKNGNPFEATFATLLAQKY